MTVITTLVVCAALYSVYRALAKLGKAAVNNPARALQWMTVARAVLPK
jgi:hypothetical protein